MNRPATLLLLAGLASLALVPRAVPATTVTPGTTSASLEALGCTPASGSLENVGDFDCPPTVCATECEASANKGKISFNVSNYTAGRRFVQTTVYTDFEVGAGNGTEGHELDGTIAYDVAWRGFWTLAGLFTGFNDVECSITLYLWDVTDGSKLVKQVQLHHLDAQAAGSLPEVGVDVGGGLDEDGTTNTLTAKVIRGHSYRIGLRLRCQGKGAFNASVVLDYLGGDGGAWWNDLTVSVSPDLAERVAELERRVEVLEGQIRHHTHEYLTGRGEGHNNTVATTSEALLVDAGEPTPEESQLLPRERPGAQPMPIRSVLAAGAPNPTGAATTIRYALPEPLPVSIRVYDALGRDVATLVDADQPAGAHEVRFDATHLAAGVYYYRIVAGRFTETRKLTLLK